MNIIYLFILFLMFGCASVHTTSISETRVMKVGSDSPNVFCNDFYLNDQQSEEFINKSREVEIKEFHDQYDYLPCFVKGKLTKNNTSCEFTIRAGGTVEFACEDGSGYLMVCDKCDDLLKANEGQDH